MQITTLGVDLAKDVFELHGVDEKGRCWLQKTVRRSSLTKVMAKLSACLVGVEASGGAHHWARAFRRLGHDVRMMNPQYVKPYVKTQKNDYNDAEAICEAVSRPSMHFVPLKEIEHQDILAVHRVRSRFGRGAHGADQSDPRLARRIRFGHAAADWPGAKACADDPRRCREWAQRSIPSIPGSVVRGAGRAR